MSSTPAPQSSPPSGISPATSGRTRPLWLRIIAVQEVGLLAVIAIMMLGIWFGAGTIDTKPVDLPAGAVVTQTSSGKSATWTVKIDGRQTEYAATDGYRFVEDRRGKRVELVERLDAPAGSMVAETKVTLKDREGRDEEQGAYVFRAGNVDSAPYMFANGWTADETNSGLERPVQVSKFLNKENLVLVLTTSSFFGIMAVGMTLIIVMGGIDLSIGSIYAVAMVAGALALRALESGASGQAVSAPVALGVAVLVSTSVGALCGLVNGVSIVGLRVHPFIITLGGMAVYRGIAFVLSKGESIGGFPQAFRDVVRFEISGINPVPALVMVAVGLVGAFVASKTTFGRRTFAIGGNEVAARYAGVPVGAVKIALFTIGGVVAGLAAAIGLGYFGSATSDSARGYELGVIAAAVVGGASLSGGRGSILGAVLGAIIIQLIENGFDVLGYNTNYKQIVLGLAIILAVLVDQSKQRWFGARR